MFVWRYTAQSTQRRETERRRGLNEFRAHVFRIVLCLHVESVHTGNSLVNCSVFWTCTCIHARIYLSLINHSCVHVTKRHKHKTHFSFLLFPALPIIRRCGQDMCVCSVEGVCVCENVCHTIHAQCRVCFIVCLYIEPNSNQLASLLTSTSS